MKNYSLKFLMDNEQGEQTVSFCAHSVARALEIAKKSAAGCRAELYQDGEPIFTMELVSETGVWLVGGVGQESD